MGGGDPRWNYDIHGFIRNRFSWKSLKRPGCKPSLQRFMKTDYYNVLQCFAHEDVMDMIPGLQHCKVKGFQTFSDSWFQGFSCVGDPFSIPTWVWKSTILHFSRCVLFRKRMVSFAMVRSTTSFLSVMCFRSSYFVGSPSVMPHLYAFMWNYRTWQYLTCNACKNHNQKSPLCKKGKQIVTYLKWSGPHFLRLNQSIIGILARTISCQQEKNHDTCRFCRIFNFWKTSKPQACDDSIFPWSASRPTWRPRSQPNHHSQWTSHGKLRIFHKLQAKSWWIQICF